MPATYLRFEPDPSGPWDRLPEGDWDICGCAEEGGGGGASFLSGNGSPEGVVTGTVVGQTYLNLTDGGMWAFAGTAGQNTGWV